VLDNFGGFVLRKLHTMLPLGANKSAMVLRIFPTSNQMDPYGCNKTMVEWLIF
jgi:hypothetical protein